jgi:RNA polymerase sigma factor (sigma-70 family)
MDTLELSIKRVSKALAFPPGDSSGANLAYVRWRMYGREADKYMVDVWTYCRVARQFQKYARRDATMSVSNRDMLVDDALLRIGRAQKTLRNWDRYAAWVSIICRNVYLSYQKRPEYADPIFGDAGTTDTKSDPARRIEQTQRMQLLLDAVDRLPPFLARIVRMRFLEDLDYAEISERTGKPVDTVRAYVSRSLARLRVDRQLEMHATAGMPAGRKKKC